MLPLLWRTTTCKILALRKLYAFSRHFHLNQENEFYESMEITFQLDPLHLGNSGGGPTQRSRCLALTNVTLKQIVRMAHNKASTLVERDKGIT
jgi:hypothetical protein